MKKKILSVFLSVTMVISLAACEKAVSDSPKETVEISSKEVPTTQTEAETSEKAREEAKEPMREKGGKQVIVYYPNWYLGDKAAGDGGEVGSIAWDSVTMVNHAFFEAYPADGTQGQGNHRCKHCRGKQCDTGGG